MSALASTAVSLFPTFANGGQTVAETYVGGLNNRALLQRSLKLVLTGQGGQTNTISASVLGLRVLVNSFTLWDAANSKGYPTVVDPVNNILIILDGSAAPAPVDVTSSAAYITVQGIV